MKNSLWVILLVLVSSVLVACGSDKASVPMEPDKVMDPVPQKGGYSNINNATLKQMMSEGGVKLIDIRRPEEWASTGVVEGSHKITFFLKNGQLNQNFLPQFTAIAQPDDKVVLICRTGNRTKAASQAIAQQLGYKQVFNVQHGITSWIRQGRPVVK